MDLLEWAKREIEIACKRELESAMEVEWEEIDEAEYAERYYLHEQRVAKEAAELKESEE